MFEAEDGYNELRAETPVEEILISLGLPRTVASPTGFAKLVGLRIGGRLRRAA